MPVDIAAQWDLLRIKLRKCGIFRSSEHDCLTWKNAKGMNSIRVKDVYQSLIRRKQCSCNITFPPILWKVGCPSKMVFFSWLLFHNKNLSWVNLRKRGWQGPGFCPICRSAEEDNYHLFFNCIGTQQLWLSLENYFGIQHLSHATIKEAFIWCSQQKESWRIIFIISVWSIWKWCNNFIFKGKSSPFLEILFNIISLYEAVPLFSPKQKKQVGIDPSQVHSSMPRAFFDGAEQNGSCGCGFHILVDMDTQFLIFWNGGRGTNNIAEAMALAGLLNFCLFLNLRGVSIYGDSKIMVEYVTGKNTISSPHLVGWLDRIKFYWNLLKDGSIHHIYRDKNRQTDALSKRGLLEAPGLWHL